jgi:hypothetical protein
LTSGLAAQSGRTGPAEPWLADLTVYRATGGGDRKITQVGPELAALAQADGPKRLHVVLELGAALAVADGEARLAQHGIELLERLRPAVWFASLPRRLVRHGLPVEVRSVRLLKAEEKLSDELRRGEYGPYGLLLRGNDVALRLTLHGDAAEESLLRSLREVFGESVSVAADKAVHALVPIHLVTWVAGMDPVRSVELDRDFPTREHAAR